MTELILPWPPSILFPNRPAHYMAKAKARTIYKNHCVYSLCGKIFPKLQNTHTPLEIIFHPPTRRGYDLDNCLAAMKAGLDGVAQVFSINDKNFRPITVDFGEVIKDGRVIVKLKKQ